MKTHLVIDETVIEKEDNCSNILYNNKLIFNGKLE